MCPGEKDSLITLFPVLTNAESRVRQKQHFPASKKLIPKVTPREKDPSELGASVKKTFFVVDVFLFLF